MPALKPVTFLFMKEHILERNAMNVSHVGKLPINALRFKCIEELTHK
jgi:hypothetical protein